ncbi:MAG: glycoside hydrolase family 31 protein [Cytophagales bacterium]|nr:glycoside hydrolase family 31 protein [Cytophagales bacterium]
MNALQALPNAALCGSPASGMVLALQDGGTFTVQMLGESLARVTCKPKAGFKEPRTWAIAPQANQDVPWEGRPRESLAGFDLAGLAVDSCLRGNDSPMLSTKRLCVSVQIQPLRLTWTDARDGKPIAADRVTSSYMTEARTGLTRHYLERVVGAGHVAVEKHFGLGDKTGPLDLTGRRLRTGGMDSIGFDPEHGDPLYKHWPFTLSRTASGQWLGIYYDTLANCTFDFGCEHDMYHGFYRYVEIDDGDLDYYLMVGDTPAEVIAQWMRLIGGTAPVPAWSVGFAQTAMGLADAPDAQHQLDQFIDKVMAHGVPISAFHYGSGYSTGVGARGKQRYVFTWNSAKFPDPKTLNAKFNANGMRLVANIKPCLLDDHPAYASMQAAGGFITNAKTGKPIVEPYWDGMGSHLDFTNQSSIDWWQKNLKAHVLDYGIDVGWNDNNEYAILDDDAVGSGFGKPMPMHQSKPLHSMLMTRATFEAQRDYAARPASVNGQGGQGLRQAQPERGAIYTISRAGSPGIQRYAQTWSGDNTTSWRTLKWNIRTGLQMSLSGMFNIGHDVGGFYGPIPSPELFLRWVQACSLNPRMVMNSWKQDAHGAHFSNVPWMHPEVTKDVIAAIALRYQLMPYLLECFARASTHHEPIIRPTFYDFPHDEGCFKDSDDFMLGSQYLVAPVVEEGARTRQVYLPKLPTGQAWQDFASGESFPSGQCHTVDAPLSKLPLFKRICLSTQTQS